MLYGLYQSAQGANVQARRLEVTTHNLANANTTAYKQDVAVVRTVPQFADVLGREFFDRQDHGLELHNGATAIADVVTDHSSGPIRPTNNTYDLAIRGPGFFRVSDGEEKFLTRNGSFVIDPTGALVMADTGLSVLDPADKPILVPPDAFNVQIAQNGIMYDQNGPFATVGVAIPPDTNELQKLGDSLYGLPEDTVDMDPALVNLMQGHIEDSGVEPISEMVSMIEISRAFELNMNMIQHQDHSLGRLLGAAAKV